MKITDETLSKSIIETTPKIMRFIRGEMRNQAKEELSVPQFRVILKLVREPNCTQQEVADWMGIAAPTLTRMLDTLMKRKLIKRVKDKKDMRRTLLSVTNAGQKLHQLFKVSLQKQLLIKMDKLTLSDKEKIAAGLVILEKLFA